MDRKHFLKTSEHFRNLILRMWVWQKGNVISNECCFKMETNCFIHCKLRRCQWHSRTFPYIIRYVFLTDVEKHKPGICIQETLENSTHQKSLNVFDVNKNFSLSCWIYQKNYWKLEKLEPVVRFCDKFLSFN